MINYKILFSLIMTIFIICMVIFLARKYKLDRKQLIIFFILALFWASVSIIRAYRKQYALEAVELGGLGLNVPLAVNIAAAYGLISFILRLPILFVSDIFNKKKLFIQISIVFTILTSFAVYFKPSYETLYYSSLAMGASASLISMFNLVFAETFSKENAVASVSILSLSPLLAEFLASPIQYLGTYSTPKNYWLLWLISGIIAIVTLFLTRFIEEPKISNEKFSYAKVKTVVTNKSFLLVCLIAIIVSFSKFATSGSNMVVYFNSIGLSPLQVAYSDVVFATPQLIAGMLVGTYLIKKMNISKILSLGIFLTTLFYIFVLFVSNKEIIFISYILNGFGYGLIYNSLIAIAIQSIGHDYQNISMGVFQLFFSAGIFWGDRIYKEIVNIFPEGLVSFTQGQSVFLLTCIASILAIILSNLPMTKKLIH